MSLRWGIAGYGWVARDHMAPAIAAAGHVLAGVADPDPCARNRAEADGVLAFDTAGALLRTLRPDALYVATPNHRHLEPVREAAAAGVPVLCEKPMAAALEDAQAMAQAVREAGVLYGTAFDQRRHPAHLALRDAVAAGAVGRPAAVRIAYCCWVDPLWRPPGAGGGAENWRADPAAAGGGAVLDLAPHGLDLVQAILGEPVERLSMTLQRRVHDYPVEDGGIVAGRTASGVLVDLHVAYNCPEALPRRRLEVLGDRGQLTALDTMGQSAGGTLTRTCGASGEVAPVSFDAETAPFTAQARAFADAVAGGAHDFSLERDLDLARRFDHAYREARACLDPYACANCGFWQRYFATPPDCPVCTDVRNDLPHDGWRFLSLDEVAATHDGGWREVAPGLTGFTTTPDLGLAGTGWLLARSEGGNVAFEAAPFYTPAMLDEIARRGGIAVLAASHAHGYGALWQLQEAFDPEVVAIQVDDLAMTKAFRVTWPYDDMLDLGGGFALHHVGGHYAGQAALHDARGRRLFCGDMFKVDQDAAGRSTAVSSHKAFHKDIPLTHRELRRYRDAIAPLAFDAVLTPFEYAPEVGRDVAVRLLDEALARRPGVTRVPL